jgi:hypothetical protein
MNELESHLAPPDRDLAQRALDAPANPRRVIREAAPQPRLLGVRHCASNDVAQGKDGLAVFGRQAVEVCSNVIWPHSPLLSPLAVM